MRRLLPLLLLLTCPSWANISFVKCTNNAGTGTSLATTLTNTPGNFMVAATREGTDGTSTWTLTDSAGQTWTQTASGYSTNGNNAARIDVRFIPNSASITSVTATFSGSLNNLVMVVCEFSGMTTASPEDTSVNSGINSFVNSLTSGTFTTTNSQDLLLYCVTGEAAITAFVAGTGYTIPTNGSAASRMACQYQIVSSTQASQTTVMTWTGTAVKAESVFTALKAAVSTIASPFVIAP